MADELLIEAKDITKVYRTGTVEAHALRGLSVEVRGGEFMAIVGPSGSGKTTFLNLAGALDTATSGSIALFGRDVGAMRRRERADLRLRALGFVFQTFNLMPVLTARENVEFILELQGVGAERSARAGEILEQLGLGHLADRRPNELSGGEQQRVAVARAVAARPRLVLADEPTASLDTENAEILMEMMRGLNERHGITFVLSTHDPRVVRHVRRVVRLVDGRIAEDRRDGRGSAGGGSGERG